jgi:hypothetical protein
MILSGTRPANHDGVEHAGDSTGQPLNRLFERHTIVRGPPPKRSPHPTRTPPAGGDAHAPSPPAPSQPRAGRASDADREQVIGVLKAAFVQERLTKDDFDARVGHAMASRTWPR